MKFLLVSDMSYGALGLSYLNAFKSLGIEAYGYDIEKDFKDLNIYTKNRYLRRIFGNIFFKTVNINLLNKIEEIKPDYIFIIKGALIHPETLKEIKSSSKAILMNYNPDNPFNLNNGASNNLIRGSIPLYDHYFIWGHFLIRDLKEKGAKNVHYLPFGFDPILHYPVETTKEEKDTYESDIAFIGTWDEEREFWLNHLKDYNISIWGESWEKLNLFSRLKTKWKKRAVYGEEFSRICNSSKIIINLIRKQNGNAHNMRTFEVPACEGFMLSTRTKEQLNFFQEGKESAYFNSPEELKEKIDYYLKHPDKRYEIAKNARKRALAEHTYEHRVKEMIKILEI